MRLRVILPHEEREIGIDPSQAGQPLTSLLRSEGLPLNTRCGERGLCKACMVEVLQDGEWVERQSCKLPVEREMVVRIGAHAMLAYRPQVLSDYRINVPFAYDPLLGEEGLGVAVDIGTTTVSLVVVRLADGEIVGRAAGFNRQMHLGDDVLTRINLCMTDPDALSQMQRAIVDETLLPLLSEALGSSTDPLKGFVLAGNTTMLHLVSGTDPSSLGVAPFTPTFLEHRVIDSAAIGLRDPREGALDAGVCHLLPGAAAYVGADITCGVLATGLLYEDGPSLLVDVGTNGEIVLKHGDKLLGCATAAGPAFEGSGLRCGVRAGDGAISHIQIDGNPPQIRTDLIGSGVKPMGLCGTAYVDMLAEGARSGLLGPSGRFNVNAVPEGLLERDEGGWNLRLALGLGKRPITVSESDMAKLLQAKAAIAAGILTLLRRQDMEPSDVRTLHLAGGFGMHLNLRNAIDCGLLPGFREDQIELVGNTSQAGAYLALMDLSILPELSRAGEMEIVELNLDPDFEDTYIDQLSLEV